MFIDSIIDKFASIEVDAFELNQKSYKKLSKKYSDYKNITIKHTDTLTDTDLGVICSMDGKYDAVIANPPYGAWRNTTERKKLKKDYNGLYSKESYTLFSI